MLACRNMEVAGAKVLGHRCRKTLKNDIKNLKKPGFNPKNKKP